MNKRINWWAIIGVVIIGLLVGWAGMGTFLKMCSKSEPEPIPAPPLLNVDKTAYSFESEGGSDTFKIESNTDWSVSVEEGQDWLSVAPARGSKDNTVTLTAKENKLTDVRTSSVKVKWNSSATTSSNDDSPSNQGDAQSPGEREITIQVTQKAARDSVQSVPYRTYLRIPSPSVTIGGNGGTNTFTIRSNTHWSVKTVSGGDWLEIGTTEGSGDKSVTVSAKANMSDKERTASLKVSWEDENGSTYSLTVSVKQKAPTTVTPTDPKVWVKVKPVSLSFAAHREAKSVSVESNTDWSVSSSSDWIVVNKNADGKGVSVSASDNTSSSKRSATLVFAWKDGRGTTQETTVRVTQDKAEDIIFTLNPKQLSYPAKGDNRVITVKSNTEWSVSGNPEWLSVSASRGTGNKSINVSASPNSGKIEREATLTFSWKNLQGVTQYSSVGIKQFAPTPFFTAKLMNGTIAADGGNKTISVKSNTEWSVSGVPNWLNVDISHGNGDKQITAIASKNNSEIERKAKLIFTWKDLRQNEQRLTIEVKQAKGKKTVECLTMKEAQDIIKRNIESNKIPNKCIISFNGESEPYGTFRMNVEMKMYTNVVVQSIDCDEMGNAKKIEVTLVDKGRR